MGETGEYIRADEKERDAMKQRLKQRWSLTVRPERVLYIVGWKRPPGKLQATAPEASFA